MKRKIIEIDQELCDGCGRCIPNCPEGAIQILDGKAQLVSDIFCDGLGACLGECPREAIKTVEREAEAYDERKVIARIAAQGEQTIRAHLEHLRDHGEFRYLKVALDYLKENGIEVGSPAPAAAPCACPGGAPNSGSALRQWPIQLHLVSPDAPHFRASRLLLAADCVAFSMGDFHSKYLEGHTLAIACPKLDSNQQIYLEKLTMLIQRAGVESLTVMIMQVPCCGGLLRLATRAVENAGRKIPVRAIVVGIDGSILQDQTV